MALATLPTPLTEASGLRAALGGAARCPRILLKRDDLTGLALGGNKARKLEYLVGDARRAGATTLVTTGAVQSNHARMTAAAARAAGMGVTLVLTTREPAPALQGNYLLDRLFGADVHLIPAGPDPRVAVAPDEEARVAEIVAGLRARGERPYVIPVGGSSAIGSLGYTAGTLEMVQQFAAERLAPSRLYYGSGSRGTQAGLELGARLFAPPYRLFGIAVSGGEPDKRLRAARVATETARLIGSTGHGQPRRALHQPGLHRRRVRHPDAGGPRSDPAPRRKRRRAARSDLHRQSDGGAHRGRPRGRGGAGRDDRLPAHGRRAGALRARRGVRHSRVR